jgi:hypothetical protein
MISTAARHTHAHGCLLLKMDVKHNGRCFGKFTARAAATAMYTPALFLLLLLLMKLLLYCSQCQPDFLQVTQLITTAISVLCCTAIPPCTTRSLCGSHHQQKHLSTPSHRHNPQRTQQAFPSNLIPPRAISSTHQHV